MKVVSEMVVLIIRTVALRRGRTSCFFLSCHSFLALGIHKFIAYKWVTVASFRSAVDIFFVLLMTK